MFWLLYLHYVNSSKKQKIKRLSIEISAESLLFCVDISMLCPNKARYLTVCRSKRICRRQVFGQTEYSVR